mgnify:CR=1 FL=1
MCQVYLIAGMDAVTVVMCYRYLDRDLKLTQDLHDLYRREAQYNLLTRIQGLIECSKLFSQRTV